jgi:uncharacterized protein with HEPN domain
MKPKRAHADYLRDILDAFEKAERFVSGLDFEAFASNDEKIFAVMRTLEIIGEAVRNLPQSTRKQYPKYLGAKWQACVIN